MPIKLPISFDRASPISLGCVGCPELSGSGCGGRMSTLGAWGCKSRGGCANCGPECDVVCVNHPQYPQKKAEIGGFGPEDLGAINGPGFLPTYVGGIDHNHYFEPEDTSGVQWVAVHLRKIFRNGKGKFQGPDDLRQFLGVSPAAKLVLSCIDKDDKIERMWADFMDRGYLSYLRRLRFSAVICPNFSVFHDEPGSHHSFNRKRSLIVAEQLTRFGIPVVPYLHGLSRVDGEFWRDFLRERSDISFVAREFQTGLRDRERGKSFLQGFERMEDGIGRGLHLVAVGEMKYRLQIAKQFRRWTLVSFNPFVLAVKRRQIIAGERGAFKRLHLPRERPGVLFARSHKFVAQECERLTAKYSGLAPAWHW